MTKLIGTKPHQAPKNADLGEMAYQNKANVNADDVHVETLEIKPEVSKPGYALVVKTNHTNNPIAMTVSDASLINGIAFSQQAFTPLCVGRDSGSTFSAFFNGRVAIAPGYGINFGGPVNSGGVVSSTNTLDDYEEGTWTPDLRSGTTSLSTQTWQFGPTATYTKIGDLVFIHLSGKLSGVGGTNSGELRVYGLPFTPKPTGGYQEYRMSMVMGNQPTASHSNSLFAFVRNGGTDFGTRIADGGDTIFRTNMLDNDTFFSIYGCYKT
jgi:hypothetical protein